MLSGLEESSDKTVSNGKLGMIDFVVVVCFSMTDEEIVAVVDHGFRRLEGQGRIDDTILLKSRRANREGQRAETKEEKEEVRVARVSLLVQIPSERRPMNQRYDRVYELEIITYDAPQELTRTDSVRLVTALRKWCSRCVVSIALFK